MINIEITSKKLTDLSVGGYAFFLEHEFDFAKLNEITKIYPPIIEAIKNRGFSGKAGSSLILSGVKDQKGVYIILLGLGDLKDGFKNVEIYRRAMGQLVRIVENHKMSKVAFTLPDPISISLSYERLAQESATIVHKAAYHFDEFITNPDRKIKWDFDLFISVDKKFAKQVQDGIDKGIAIGHAINQARYWCDMPPSRLTPTILADDAEKIAKKYGLKATVFKQKEIIKMGMGGIEGVSRGSVEECKLAILEYKTTKKNAPTLAIVGKGITFDSGGLSLKPAQAMETMKDDMAGAAVVLATMQVIAQFKPDINVIALTPISENMPSGSALKPGDVIKFYNGKTAEVKNTDAEGRLVLADALSYAIKNYKLDAIIDVATLTGACAHALGPFYCGLFSQHEELTQKVIKASEQSGDRVCRLPMDNDYRPAIFSDIADISNIGSPKYNAGAITAAFFLQNFVGNVPWVHLDIAGPAFGMPDMSYLRPGATGFGIRLLTDLIMSWNKK